MRFKKFLYVFILIPWLWACNDNTAVKDTLKCFIGREVYLPLEDMRSMKNGRDTIFMRPTTSAFKEIIFVDSTSCTSCMYKYLYKWNPVIKEVMEKYHNVEFFFILHPSKSSRIGLYHEMMQPHIFSETVFIDTAGIFAQRNPSIPDESIYHSFLLDEKNRVVMVGDPTRNQKLHDLFLSKLKP